MKKLTKLLLLFMFCMNIAKADVEPGNNAPGTTTDVLTLNGSKTGTIGVGDNDDYYKLTTTSDGNISISLTNATNGYTYVYLYDQDGATQLGTVQGSPSLGISFTANGLAAGNYFVRVYSTAATENYTLSNTLTVQSIANDAEPNNSPATAGTLAQNGTVHGHIAYRSNGGTIDNDDYYKIVTTADGDLSLNLTNDNNGYTYIYILDNDGSTQLAAAQGNPSSGIVCTATGVAAGTYIVRVFASSYSGYDLSNSLALTGFTNDLEPNNDKAQAISFAENSSVQGHIAHRINGGTYDNYDWYVFTTTSSDGDITLTLTGSNNSYNYIYLYDADGVTQLASTQGNSQSGISCTKTGLEKGTYYAVVYSGSGSYNGYTLQNTVTPIGNPVDLEPNNDGAHAIVLNPNSKVTGHIAYRNNGGSFDTDDFYKLVTTNDGRLQFTLERINNNYNYIYLYDADTVTQLGAAQGNIQTAIGFSVDGLAAGTYFVRVYGGAGSYNGYTLTDTLFTTLNINDNEPNNTPAQASNFAVNSSSVGHIAYRNSGGTYDTDDYYKIVTAADGDIALSLANNNNNNYTYIYLYDADGSTQLAAAQGNSGLGLTTSKTGLAAGTYYIRVSAGAGGFAAYTLTNVFTPAQRVNDPETNNDFATAKLLNHDPDKSGHIAFRLNGGSYDADDYRKVIMYTSGSMNINIAFDIPGNYQYVYLYNSAQTQIYAQQGNAGTYNINFPSLAAGDYYLRVYGGSVYNTYTIPTFEVPCDPAASSITAAGSTTFCQGGNVTLNATNNAYTAYLWSTGATTSSINVTSSGTYTLTATDVEGCATHVSNSIAVTVNPLPAVPVITPSGATTFCAGGSVTLTSNAASSYLWSTGATTQSINATTNGNYSVTVTNANGCSRASGATAVTVNALPSTPVITPSGATTFCAGGSVTLTSSNATSYLWSTGATTQSINANTNGTFSVTVTNANGCSAISAVTTLTVNANPAVTFAALSSKCTTDAAFALTGGSPAGGTYSGTGVSAGQFNPATAGVGTFTITYNYTNGNGCSGSATQTISVTNCGGCTPTITPSGATSFCTGGSVTLTASAGNNYSWSTGATTQSINVSVNGSYSVTVTNASNCTGTSSATVVTVNALPSTPVITPSGATTFCNGGSVTLTSSAASSYLWSTGATTQAINVTSGGSFSVTISNASGCTATSSATSVTANSLPSTPVITPSGATTFCAGGSVTLTSSNATSYLWSTGATTQSINANTNGTFSVTVTNANGCSATSAATTVTVNANPAVTFAALSSKCTTDAAFALTGGSPAGGTYSGTGVSAGQFNPATAGVGTFTITYNYTNGNGCSGSATQTISVTNCGGCTPTVSSGGAVTFCQGGSVVLTASVGNSYAWSNGATTRSITVTTTGNYSVTVTNASGCSGTSSATVVTVNPLPAVPTITAGGAITFCSGGSVVLTSGTATSYAWSNGATTQSITVTTSGNYSVTVKNTNGCSATSAAKTVTVNPKPTATISGTTTVCAGTSTTLTAAGGSTYSWSNGASSQAITVSPAINSVYTVTVTSAAGCSSSAMATVSVNNCNGTYCSANGTTKTKGYIGRVKFNTINKSSGWNNGYANFLSTSTSVTKGKSYSITVTPAYPSCFIYCLYTRVWIDWNQDGDFADAGELAFAPSGSTILPRCGTIKVPATALAGATRMRVIMEYGAIPSACGTFTYGEVEDYTVNIVNGSNVRLENPETEAENVTPQLMYNVYPNPAMDFVTVQTMNSEGVAEQNVNSEIEIMDLNGKIILKTNVTGFEQQLDVTKIQSGIYMMRVIPQGNYELNNSSMQKLIITH